MTRLQALQAAIRHLEACAHPQSGEDLTAVVHDLRALAAWQAIQPRNAATSSSPPADAPADTPDAAVDTD